MPDFEDAGVVSGAFLVCLFVFAIGGMAAWHGLADLRRRQEQGYIPEKIGRARLIQAAVGLLVALVALAGMIVLIR